LQAIFILFAERIWPVIVLIEDSELHCTIPVTSSGAPRR